MEDYSVFFRDEPSSYVWLSLSKLRQDYVCIEVHGYPVDGQTRFAFWVAGDGLRTMLYFTTGLAEVVPNSSFKVERVVGAMTTKVVDGRLTYLMDEQSVWKDLGPITPEGVRPGDHSVDEMRRAHLKNKSDAIDDEEKAQVKKALKHNFWGKGGSF